MRNIRNVILAFLLGIFIFSALDAPSVATGSGRSFVIHQSAFSGGGQVCSSDTYIMYGTIGQSSALMDPLELPCSPGCENTPGFWYTLEADLRVKAKNFLPAIYHLLLEED